MAYNAGKKILHCCVSGKRFKLQRFGKKEILTQTKSPIQKVDLYLFDGRKNSDRHISHSIIHFTEYPRRNYINI